MKEKDAIEPGELTDEQKRDNVIRYAFGGDVARLQRFCETLAAELPPETAAVLGGSSVTGFRWEDGEPFDAGGPGTSDIDLTLVGDEVLQHFSLAGSYVPGVHTRPLNDETLDIAPALVPLREKLMEIVDGRPVNIQATRDFYVWVREHWLGQPYLLIVGKVGDAS
ncbi:MAG: hypothetical protein ACK4S4_00815 [Pyrinomonadaceae bacterium]